ncbi:MAG: hypothetical protein ACRC91_21765 [Aeromonas sp.]
MDNSEVLRELPDSGSRVFLNPTSGQAYIHSGLDEDWEEIFFNISKEDLQFMLTELEVKND